MNLKSVVNSRDVKKRVGRNRKMPANPKSPLEQFYSLLEKQRGIEASVVGGKGNIPKKGSGIVLRPELSPAQISKLPFQTKRKYLKIKRAIEKLRPAALASWRNSL